MHGIKRSKERQKERKKRKEKKREERKTENQRKREKKKQKQKEGKKERKKEVSSWNFLSCQLHRVSSGMNHIFPVFHRGRETCEGKEGKNRIFWGEFMEQKITERTTVDRTRHQE